MPHGRHPLHAEGITELVGADSEPLFIDEPVIQPPRWAYVGTIIRENDPGHLLKPRRQRCGGSATCLDQGHRFAKLGPRDCALQFRHPVVLPEEQMNAARLAAPPFVDEQARTLYEILPVHQGDAAVSTRDLLGLLQAEAAEVAERPDLSTPVFREMSLGAIFDQRNATRSEKLLDRAHVGWASEQVNDDDRPGAVCDPCRDAIRGQVPGDRIDVREHRDAVGKHDWDDGPHVGHRRRDDLVARIGIDRGDGDVDGGRAGPYSAANSRSRATTSVPPTALRFLEIMTRVSPTASPSPKCGWPAGQLRTVRDPPSIAKSVSRGIPGARRPRARFGVAALASELASSVSLKNSLIMSPSNDSGRSTGPP